VDHSSSYRDCYYGFRGQMRFLPPAVRFLSPFPLRWLTKLYNSYPESTLPTPMLHLLPEPPLTKIGARRKRTEKSIYGFLLYLFRLKEKPGDLSGARLFSFFHFRATIPMRSTLSRFLQLTFLYEGPGVYNEWPSEGDQSRGDSPVLFFPFCASRRARHSSSQDLSRFFPLSFPFQERSYNTTKGVCSTLERGLLAARLLPVRQEQGRLKDLTKTALSLSKAARSIAPRGAFCTLRWFLYSIY